MSRVMVASSSAAIARVSYVAAGIGLKAGFA